MPAKPLPEAITSYDLLKTLAVVLMVVDHLGYYFFYDDPWWRAVGRVGFPVWFFLVGYSTGRAVPARLIAAAVIVLAANPLVGLALLPLNALFTIIAFRLVLDHLMRFALHGRTRLWAVSAALAAIAMPSCVLTEYGTLGLTTAMFGYLVQHRKTLNNESLVLPFMIFALLSFVIYQQKLYEFTASQFTVMALLTTAMHIMILQFRPHTFQGMTAACPRALTAVIQLCGRSTLEIYVVHLIAFGVLAVMLGLPGMGWLRWQAGLSLPGF